MPSLAGQPVRIIGFRNRKEYAPYKPNETASAFYLSWNGQDAIVIGDLSDENRRTVTHEYVHLLVRMGSLLPGRYQLLQRGGWLYSLTRAV